MSAAGSSMALMRPSKGERRLTSRAGGEHRTHGDEAGPEDLVCTRSSGGGRRGGGDFRIGDALMLSNPNKRARKGKIRINELNSASDYALIKKLLTNRIDAIRRDLKMYKYKGGHLPSATFYRRTVRP
jgi:hypothetical protein